jgi:hypothetical protein
LRYVERPVPQLLQGTNTGTNTTTDNTTTDTAETKDAEPAL